MSYLGRSCRSGGKLVRVLVIDPCASVESASPCPKQFDRVIDLGVSGRTRREALEDLFHCQVESAQKLGSADFARIREIFSAGMGEVVDEHGIDWWELAAVKFYEQLELLLRLKKVSHESRLADEVFVSRPGINAGLLELLLKRPVRILQSRPASHTRLRHYAHVLSRFSPRELLQISADKYDAGYRWRRILAPKLKPSARPVVLLPSAYVNASQIAMRYAKMLPESNFLLIATRASGRAAIRSDNVELASLASYTSATPVQSELQVLLDKWNGLKSSLLAFEEFAILDRLGSLDFILGFLQDGLAVRNAWLNVFERERVTAVLCADEANPFTCLPVLIANRGGLPTLACHHGALDGRYRFLRVRSNVYLAKGRMEHEYLVRNCGVPEKKTEIGAPLTHLLTTTERPKRFVVFFSEPYEVLGGRCIDFYNEILPPLAEIASETGHELIVKLHPFESRRERFRAVNKVLGTTAQTVTRVIAGPLHDELLSQTWSAVTVLSSTAVDCTLRGIPVFLCKWLDCSHYDYAEQFAKFGAGTILASANELRKIPAMMKSLRTTNPKDLCETIDPHRLTALLNGSLPMAAAV